MNKEEYIELIDGVMKSPRSDSQKANVLKGSFKVYVKDSMDKLSQYEALGFTPDDIACLAKFYKERTSAKAIAEDMKVAAQLMEWAKLKDLEAEGRLVILPCKIGDEVYQVYEHETETFTGKCERCDTDCSSYDICWHYDYEWRVKTAEANANFMYKYLNRFGKEIFLSREEAEKEAERRNCFIK